MIYKTKHTEVDFWFKDKHSIIQRRTMILEGLIDANKAEEILTTSIVITASSS